MSSVAVMSNMSQGTCLILCCGKISFLRKNWKKNTKCKQFIAAKKEKRTHLPAQWRLAAVVTRSLTSYAVNISGEWHRWSTQCICRLPIKKPAGREAENFSCRSALIFHMNRLYPDNLNSPLSSQSASAPPIFCKGGHDTVSAIC